VLACGFCTYLVFTCVLLRLLQDEKAALDERHDLRNGNYFNCLLVSLACA
jgi:hypothetical protein